MITKLFFLIENKKKFFLINIYYLCLSIAEIFGIAIISLLVGKIFLNQNLEKINFLKFDFFSKASNNTLILFALLALTLRLIFFILGNYHIKRYVLEINKRLKLKYLDYYLSGSFYKKKNLNISSAFTIFTEKIDRFSNKVLESVIRFISNSIICASIILFLALINLKITLLIAAFTTIFICVYLISLSNFIKNLSAKHFKNVEENFKNFSNIIHNSIPIRLYQKKKIFLNNSKNFLSNIHKGELYYFIISLAPRHVIELALFVFIFGIYAIVSIYTNIDQTVIIYGPVLIISFYRLLPYSLFYLDFLNELKFLKKPILEIEKFLLDVKKIKKPTQNSLKINSINLKNIDFSYPNSKKIFNQKNVNIKRNEIIGIFGDSGSGKSTLLKILLGFEKVQRGSVLINKKSIERIDKDAYWNNFSYIPQNSLLLDCDLRQNISLETNEQNQNQEKLIECLEITGLKKKFKLSRTNNFNKKSLENLSGGEKQRVSIARSLYFDRDYIIFDEATNALDEKNQLEILKKIISNKNKSLIIITHNKKILKICNKKIFL